MPEENFEQQARKLTEHFSMEPKPAVWLHIKAAIAPKRKRRALLWWWLLPFCIAGGLGIWHKHITTLVKGKQTSSETTISKNNENNLHTKTAITKAGKKQLQNKKEENKVTQYLQSALKKKKVKTGVQVGEISAKKIGESKNHVEWILQNEQTNTIANNKENDRQNSELNKREVDSSSFAGNQVINNVSIADSMYKSSQNQNADIETVISSNVDSVGVVKDSGQQKRDSTLVVNNKKKQTKKSYSIGVVAEAGIASWGNSLFSSGEKSAQSFSSPSFLSLSDFSSGTITQYSVKKGTDLSIGLILNKRLLKKMELNGQLTYRYQKFDVSQTVFIDTSTGGSNQGGRSGVYYYFSAKQRFYFANLYTGISWQFLQHKQTSVSLQTGFDNNWLLSVSQKQNGHPDTIKSIPARNFYQWQPFLTVAIPFDLYGLNKSHFELSPFIRFGIRAFQKNTASYKDNHLTSAGIKVIYFFK